MIFSRLFCKIVKIFVVHDKNDELSSDWDLE